MRWLAATITASLILGVSAIPVDAFSFDPDKIDASFLAEVLAAPTADFDVIVRSDPVDAEKHLDRAAARRIEAAAKSVTKQGGSLKHALAIVGGVSARLKGTGVLKLTRDKDIDYVVKDRQMRAQFDPALDSANARTPGILEVNAPQVWSQLGMTGQGVGVAIVDSGVYPHPDLAGRIVASIDFTTASPTVSTTSTGDPGGHGRRARRQRNGPAVRRPHGRVLVAWPHPVRLPLQAGPRGAGPQADQPPLAGQRARHALPGSPGHRDRGADRGLLPAVGHVHGGAGGHRCHRAHDRAQPEPLAGPDQEAPQVHCDRVDVRNGVRPRRGPR